ncbi:hypothetical protein K1T71_008506 [Dendrolimus kikuchii]|uniref:Uncharacterized protein n=1 Tax=Dendrolimus kikuchii TaxID=765133 RepID=A0ACC1CYX6_9NEOP|nr:hypothetical protein K1T71_008506 [Dendrolimus kikuchii]
MALWTPYADEALDLTKTIKKETPSYDHYQYQQDYHHPYQYPVYNGQVSPVSGVSVSSHEWFYPSSFRPAPLSPPASPSNENGFLSPSNHLYKHTVPPIEESRASYTGVPTSYEHRIPFQHSALPIQMPVAEVPRHCQRSPFGDVITGRDHPAVLRETSYRKRSYDAIEVDSLSDNPDFQEFERDALRAMAEKNGGVLLGNNPKMRRAVRSNNDTSDDSYRKQRDRNNFAAKQSRDRRKLREIHLALKVSYLRREVAGLKALLAGKVCSRCQQSCRC